jgi:hypothetical protein
MPRIPLLDNRPPRLYDLLESLVNYGKPDKTKIKNLAKESRNYIFDFDYPLSNKVDKEKFETMIINHFILRRIGFETFTSFQIQLNVKLNEIMPLYNKMFDSLDGWNIFNDGEIVIRDSNDNRTINNSSKASNKLENKSDTTTNRISDRRYSNTPQNELENLKNGSYVTDANYDQEENKSSDKSNSNGESNATSNTKDDNISHETIKRSPSDKIAIYKEFQDNLKSIYNMIFKDLDCLFYQLV